jgi:TatA/E family protein of Tat protein translocase
VNLFGMGPMELILIVVLALIVFGPAKLPEIMGQVGKAVNDFRKATSELSDEFNKTIQAELQETKSVVDEAKSVMTEAKSVVGDVHSTVNSAVSGAALTTAVTPSLVPGAGEPIAAANGTNGTSTTSETAAPAETNGVAEPEAVHETSEAAVAATTPQWSWDAAPTAAEKEAAATTAETDAAAATADEVKAETEPATTADAKPKPETAERAGRDELLPPY